MALASDLASSWLQLRSLLSKRLLRRRTFGRSFIACILLCGIDAMTTQHGSAMGEKRFPGDDGAGNQPSLAALGGVEDSHENLARRAESAADFIA